MQTSDNILPTATGQNLGSDGQRWDLFAQTIDATQIDGQLSNIRIADQFAGADMGAKINAAIADLPSTGGVVDARGFEGVQAAAATVTLNKPVQLLIGAVTLVASGSPGFYLSSDGASIVGEGQSISILVSGANATLISIAAGATAVNNLKLDGSSATFATAKGIVIASGHAQLFDSLRMIDWGGVPFQVTADQGIFMMLTNSYVAPVSPVAGVIAFQVVGADTTPTHRHLSNIDTGGSEYDIQGAETTVMIGCTGRNITMTTSSKKLIMQGCRFTSELAATIINGINHSIVGNVIAGPFTIGSSVQGSVIGPNVTVGAMTNNATSSTNVIIDHNGYSLIPKLGIGVSAVSAGVGMYIRPATSTGTSQYGMQVVPEVTSAATSEAAGIVVRADTAAAGFTCTNNYGIYIQDATKGSGSTITTQTGLYIAAQTQGGTNYGIFSAHTGIHRVAGSLTSSSASGGVGYATGAGGAQTQQTNSATAVALNKVCGQITTVALTTAAGAEEEFTFNNTSIAATDVVSVCSTYAGAGTPVVSVKGVASQACVINITNLHGTNALNAVVVINFVVIKGVAA